MYEWVIIVSILQGTSGLVLNTLAWLVILRTKSLHNMTNYLLAYLAIVDSIFCCYLIAFFATLENQLPQSFIGKEIYCRIVKSGFLLTFIAYSSTCALCLVTYERYIGIVHPLHYPRKMSAKKVIMIIFIAMVMVAINDMTITIAIMAIIIIKTVTTVIVTNIIIAIVIIAAIATTIVIAIVISIAQNNTRQQTSRNSSKKSVTFLSKQGSGPGPLLAWPMSRSVTFFAFSTVTN